MVIHPLLPTRAESDAHCSSLSSSGALLVIRPASLFGASDNSAAYATTGAVIGALGGAALSSVYNLLAGVLGDVVTPDVLSLYCFAVCGLLALGWIALEVASIEAVTRRREDRYSAGSCSR